MLAVSWMTCPSPTSLSVWLSNVGSSRILFQSCSKLRSKTKRSVSRTLAFHILPFSKKYSKLPIATSIKVEISCSPSGLVSRLVEGAYEQSVVPFHASEGGQCLRDEAITGYESRQSFEDTFRTRGLTRLSLTTTPHWVLTLAQCS
jgi:hypothetical protein